MKCRDDIFMAGFWWGALAAALVLAAAIIIGDMIL